MNLGKSDGNGNYTISKTTTVTVGLVLALLAAAMSFAAYSAAHSQVLAAHVSDPHVHWSKAQLDEAYMPRRELAGELRAIREQLDRIEARLERQR